VAKRGELPTQEEDPELSSRISSEKGASSGRGRKWQVLSRPI